MAVYKDEERGTWYCSFHYNDWTGKNCRKLKRGFKTRRELKEFLGKLYGLMDTDRIFYYIKTYLHKEMTRGAKKACVKRIRVHDLRHSHVSLLINMDFQQCQRE